MNGETDSEIDELRADYDEATILNGIRGKYVERYTAGTKLVRLAPDVAAAFPDDAAVNEALRLLMRIARATSDHAA